MNLKQCIFLFALLFPLVCKAQMYERGKKNFFVEPEFSLNFSNYKRNAFTSDKFGMSYGLSGGKTFGGLLKAGFVYRFNQNSIGHWDSTGLNHTTITRQFAGAKAEVMIPFMTLSTGKSKHYECTYITNYLMIGPEFGANFGSNSTYKFNSTEFLLNASYGLHFKKSGSRKGQAGNDFYTCINIKKGMSWFGRHAVEGQKFYSTYIGLSLLWVHYKTGNWLR